MAAEDKASRRAAKKKGRNRLGNLMSRFFGTKSNRTRSTTNDNSAPKRAGDLAQRKRFLDSL